MPHILLEVLPRLAPGVYVHFHDIFLPYEYPREWVVTKRRAWAEQYMLHAFLAYNREFEVVLPVHALARAHLDVVRRHVPSWGGGGTGPGAFWIRRLPDPAHDGLSSAPLQPSRGPESSRGRGERTGWRASASASAGHHSASESGPGPSNPQRSAVA